MAGVPDDVKGEVVKAWVVKRAGTNPTRRRAARVLPAEPRAIQEPGARRVQGVAAENDGRKSAAPGSWSQSTRRVAPSREVDLITQSQLLIAMPASSPARTAAASSAAPGVSPCTQIVSTSMRQRGAVTRRNLAVAHHSHRALGGAAPVLTAPRRQHAAASTIRRARTSDRQTLPPPPQAERAMRPTAAPIRAARRARECHRTTRRPARSPRRYRHAARSCCRARRAASHAEAPRLRPSRSRERADLIQHEIGDVSRVRCSSRGVRNPRDRETPDARQSTRPLRRPCARCGASQLDRPHEIRTRCCRM